MPPPNTWCNCSFVKLIDKYRKKLYNAQNYILKQMKKLCYSMVLLMLACTDATDLRFANVAENSSILLGDPLDLSIDGLPTGVDSIQYYIDNQIFDTKEGAAGLTLNSDELTMGQHTVSALVFQKADKRLRVSSAFTLFAPAPKQFRYEIINTYPHDSTAYTQGLQYTDGMLYETTGLKGASTLRTVDLKSGKVIKSKKLGDSYFGEGMTLAGDRIYVLTYQQNTCFVFDRHSFELMKTFNYDQPREGWGLTYDGKALIKTDGSNVLYFIDPKTFHVTHTVPVFDNKGPVLQLNELEYIDGKVYANIYQEDYVVVINPLNGVVESKINLIGIYNHKPEDNELNGIAYNKRDSTLYITGKMWPYLFEIRPQVL